MAIGHDLTLKCVKRGGAPLDDLEKQVAQTLLDIQQNSGEQKVLMREMTFVGAREMHAAGKKCIVIYVPVPQLKLYRQVQSRLIRELEKKFDGAYVMFVAFRRILPKQNRGSNKILEKQKRPRSRTMNSVHEAILADLVFPSEVVGKRTRVKLDGKRTIKVHLDKTQQTNVEHKTDAIGGVYKSLTGKDVTFEFPEPIF